MSKKDREAQQFDRLKTSSYQPSSESTATESWSVDKKPSVGKRLARGLLVLLIVVFVLTSIVTIWSMRNFSVMSERMFDGDSALKLVPTTPLKTDAAGRTNILIVGYAADRPDHGGSQLTDTILLLSLDGTDGAYMLSIPRDLYVDTAQYQPMKINAVYQAGERTDFSEPGYRDGGIGLLEKIITENFGLDIHYQATTNFTAVEQIVDALGGVEVEIDSPDDRGLYDPNFKPDEGGALELENGRQSIDGKTALRLTRARGSAGGFGFPQSDFNRTRNQQKVLVAIADELTWERALDPRINGALFDSVSANTETDLRMSELIPMYRALTRVPVDKIDSYTLRDIEDTNLLTDYTSFTNGDALIPASGIGEYEQIKRAIQSIHE